MNSASRILAVIGLFFIFLGGVISIIFGSLGAGPFVLIPLLFVVLGIGSLSFYVINILKKRSIRNNGKAYAAKIFGYVRDTSVTVNGAYTNNTKVRYFDEENIKREAVLPTGFASGSSAYPIGMTIDIYEQNGKYAWDKDSVRNERLPREADLMDATPVEPEKLQYVSVSCPHCGSTFATARGYIARCPYCDSPIDV